MLQLADAPSEDFQGGRGPNGPTYRIQVNGANGERVTTRIAYDPSRAAWHVMDDERDVEVAAVTVEDTHAWTFAFAAFGPTMGRREALVASWQALLADTPCPERPRPFCAQASGYPEWLALLTTLGRTATIAT